MEGILPIESLKELSGKKVLLRASLNVPVSNGSIRDDFRLKRAQTTIDFLQKRKARTIVVGHRGREGESLRSVFSYFKERARASFVENCIGEQAEEAVALMEDGDLLFLENTRMHAGEVSNDDAFARRLASLAEIYVNDAFAASHRHHASIVGVPHYLPSYLGIAFKQEIEHLSKALEPPQPSLFVLGGAKFETKQPLIEKLLEKYERIFIGGALANDFFKARGYEVGRSLLSSEPLRIDHLIGHEKILLPSDVVVEAEHGSRRVKDPQNVEPNDSILDAGPKALAELAQEIEEKAFVLWNGPLGNYERGFNDQTEGLARVLAGSKTQSVVGGGDTVAAIAKLGLMNTFDFVSTGGGAMLSYLYDGTLPGLDALRQT